jgi:hypothetical protein
MNRVENEEGIAINGIQGNIVCAYKTFHQQRVQRVRVAEQTWLGYRKLAK